MFNRLRADFQLTIITLFGACAVLGLLPFAVYRFHVGNLLVGTIDAMLVLGLSGAVVYAWRRRDTRRPGLFMAILSTAATIASSTILGEVGRNWMYVALMSNFFLVDRRLATICAVAALSAMAVSESFESTLQMVSFLISTLLVSAFAFIFAARTESQRLQLEDLATHDSLTGVDNRRAMERELQMAVETHQRSRLTHGLVMLDLDHFKRVNDRYGHDAGDQVLIDFARLIRKSIRKVDRLFRFGGEEFVLLLPGADVAGLERVTDSLRETVATGLRCPAGPVTCSLGAASLRPDEGWHSWLSRVDAALYRAKGSGRNCAVIDRTTEAIAACTDYPGAAGSAQLPRKHPAGRDHLGESCLHSPAEE